MVQKLAKGEQAELSDIKVEYKKVQFILYYENNINISLIIFQKLLIKFHHRREID